MARLIVHLSCGEPFLTGEECPACHFDSMFVILLLLNNRPDFRWYCGRSVCRDAQTPA